MASVLKEFLVSIGFEVDENSYRRFTGTMEGVESELGTFAEGLEMVGGVATKVVTALIAAAGATAAFTVSAASDMDKLNFAAQRTGDSAKNLTTFGYAMSQIGIDAHQAESAVERMSSALRTSPGLNGMLGALGVDANAAPTEKILQLVDKLRQMPQYLGAQYGKMYGLDESTLYLMEKNYDKLRGFSKEGGDLLAKDRRDPDEDAAEGNKLTTHKRELGFRADDLRYRAMEGLASTAEGTMAGLDKTADEIAKMNSAADVWTKFTGLASKALDKLADAAGKVTTEFKSWINQFEGYSPKVYPDIGGKATSGYGHLMRPGEKAPANKAEAEALRDRDMSSAANELAKAVKVSLTEGQKSALEDFIYRAGAGNFEKYIAPSVNSGDMAAVATHLRKFDAYHDKQGRLVHSSALAARANREAREFSNTVNQKTDIHVTSVGGAEATAAAVARAQDKTNTLIVRSMAGVAR